MAVRRERVVLELEDHFAGPLARDAAAVKAFEKSLDDLDSTTVRTDRDTTRLGSDSGGLAKTGKQSRTASREVDRMSGRLRLLADTALILGPALIPIGAIAVPAVTALASQFGAAAVAGGTMLAAFQGVGDALDAVNKAALEPTSANLEAARLAMHQLGPDARELVRQIQDMRPAFAALRDAAAAGLFPGLSEALSDMETVFPRAEGVLTAVGDAAGDVAAEFAEGIAGPRGREFLTFIETEVPGALVELGHTVGNLVGGLGELWMAFTPLNRDVTGWLLDASRAFDDWATGLSQTQGFQEFVAYLRENGPRVADALGSMGNAVLKIVEAAAPLGGPTLQALTAFADVVAAIASSHIGPTLVVMASGMALLSRSLKAIEAVKASTLFSAMSTSADGAAGKMSKLGRATTVAAAAFAGLAIVDAVQGGLEDHSIGVEAMTQSLLDLQAATGSGLPENLDGITNSIDRLTNPNIAEGLQDQISGVLGGAFNEDEFDDAKAQIDALDSALSGLVSRGRVDLAKDALSGLGLSDSQMKDLLALLPQYKDALAGAENQSRLTGAAGEEAGRRSADGFRRAKSAAEQFGAAVAKANRILEGRASVRDYEAALDDLTKSVKDNGKSLDITTRKGRANQAALDAIASSALDVADGMKGTNKVEFLRAARKDMVDAAEKLGLDHDKAKALADRLLGLDKINASPQITVDTARAEGNVRNLLNAMAQIRNVSRTVTVTTVFTGGGKHFKDVPAGADGMTVPGSRYPYRDSVLALLAPTEEVISNRHGEADAFRRDRAAGRIPAYANGGEVQAMNRAAMSPSFSPSVAVAAPSVVFPDRLVLETDLGPMVARPIYEALSDRDAHNRSRSLTNYRGPADA